MAASMTRAHAMGWMVVVTLLWSTAGVVTKRLDAAASFEVTFWRSAFNALTLVVLLGFLRGPRAFLRSLVTGGWPLAVSSCCWAIMFTAFMMAMTMTTVANVLVTMALGPLLTALLSRVALRHRLPGRTWVAMALAAVGIVWMVGAPAASWSSGPGPWVGMAVALGVPMAAAVNWTLMQWLAERGRAASVDMMPAVVWGALISAASTWPLAQPLVASHRDLAWLAFLGAFQLAVPCLMAVALARVLKAPEISLLALCEVVFGVAWAWLGTNESPTLSVVGGGLLVVLALVVNEALGLVRAPGKA